MKPFYSLYLLPLLFFSQADAQSQKYSLWLGSTFLKANGDTMHNATAGGINQGQFSMTDLNLDGKKDIVIFERTGNRFSTFINHSQNGRVVYKYDPRYEGAFPQTTDWALMVDYNFDGKEDLYTYGGNVNVSLYRNISQNSDTIISFRQKTFLDDNLELSPYLQAFTFSPFPQFDTSEMISDFNNLPAIADIDNDGDMDYLTLLNGGIGISLYRNTTADNNQDVENMFFEDIDWCWGDFEEGVNSNDIFLSRPQFCGRKIYKKHASGSTLTVFDNDDDGDFELLLGNGGYNNLIFLENGRIQNGTKQDTMVAFDAFFLQGTRRASMPSFPAAYLIDVDQDGARDMILTVNNTDKTDVEFLETDHVWYYRNAGQDKKPDFQFVQHDFLIGGIVDHGGWAAPALIDIDNDGDQDLFIGHNGNFAYTLDQSDRIAYYENVGSSTSPVFQLRDTNYLNVGARNLQRIRPHFADIDGDDDFDLLLGQANGKIALFRNGGNASNPQLSWETEAWNGLDVGESSSIATADVNEDGELDLILGERNGNFNYYRGLGGERYVLENDTFGNVFVNGMILQTFSDPVTQEFYDSLVMEREGFSAPVWTDLDGNGKPELITGTSRGYLRLYHDLGTNQSDTFQEQEGFVYDFREQNYAYYNFGPICIPAAADLDGDGFKEIVVGNRRGGISIVSSKGIVGNTPSLKRKLEGVKLYPNPSQGVYQLLLPIGQFNVSISDINGRLIYEESLQSTGSNASSVGIKQSVRWSVLPSNSVF
jgi:hypothetical protein